MADAKDAPLGSGVAAKARDKIAIKKAYDKHVIEAEQNGEDPMSLDEFIQKMQDNQNAENEAFRNEMKS